MVYRRSKNHNNRFFLVRFLFPLHTPKLQESTVANRSSGYALSFLLAFETTARCSSRLPSASFRSFSLKNALTRVLSASGKRPSNPSHCRCWRCSISGISKKVG